ncbi:MAG: thrombospondin type-1 domain-containing protein [Candidatus Paceibacterota bacterium]
MNIKIKLSILSVLALAGLFAGINNVSAQYVVQNCDSATLNGYVDPNGNPTIAWFEWGPTQSLGYTTPPQTYYSYTNFSYKITGLTENSTYYYKTKFRNSPQGEWSGSLISFTTPACQVVNPPIDGGWSDWSAKDNSCGISGVQTRTCTNPSPANGGAYCSGPSTQSYTNPACVSVPTVSLTAGSTNVNYNGSTYLSWSSTNATSCTASGGNSGWSGNKNTSGNFYTGSLTNTTTYNITCTGQGGNVSDSVTIYVDSQSISNPTVNLTADNTNVNYGSSTYLRWTSSNATSCNVSGGGWSGSQNLSGSFYTGSLYNTTTYNITCTNSVGSASDSVTVYVNNQNSTPSVSTNSATNIGNNYATLNGYVSSNGNTSVSAWFEWGTNSNYYSQTSQINYGSNSSTSYNYYLSGLAQNTTYYYRAVAQGSNGQTVYGNQMIFTTTGNYYYTNQQPFVTTYSATGLNNNSAILNGYVDPNGSYTTRWFEWGTSYSYLNTTTSRINQGTYAGNFSETLYNLSQNTTYYYRAAARGSNGQTVYGNTLTFTTNSSYIYYNYYNTAPTAITTMATNISQSSARLGGLGSVNNAVYTTGYFEWGTTQALENTTVTRNIGNAQSNPFFENLSNLASGVTYYYRAVVTNQYGTSRGDIISFTTISPTITTPVIYKNTTVVTNTSNTNGAKSSLVVLSVSRDGEIITKGNSIEYVVNYKNVSSKNLMNVVLQIAIPKELQFVEASRGYFSSDNSTLVANIDTLNSQEEGSVRVTIKVTTDAQVGKIVVVTANLAYTIVNTKTQEEVFAYAKNTVQDTGTIQQGALAFLFGNSFFPSTLIGWLLLILIITLVVLAARKAYYGPRALAVSKK